jgi:hypothetical protein
MLLMAQCLSSTLALHNCQEVLPESYSDPSFSQALLPSQDRDTSGGLSILPRLSLHCLAQCLHVAGPQ